MVETGLIIAAGAGSRLADKKEIPKPLRKVAGLTLLERILQLAARAGLKKMVIVVGFEKERIIDYVNSRVWPLTVEFVDNFEWRKSNGVSVLCAKDALKENFVLLMSDHIFESQTLADLRQTPMNQNAALLAVDYKIDRTFDMDDATKVVAHNGQLAEIGKELQNYNCIDTGMFLMTPEIFTALESAHAKKGDCSLSDGIKCLADAGRMGVYDIGARYWQDVDTPESRVHAEKILRQGCRKDTDGFVSRHFNRYVSLAISAQLVKTPLTPNQMTYLIFLCTGLPAAYLAARGGYWDFLFATVLFKLSSILDGVDGEMAKMKLASSKLGQWLDTICDNLTYLFFFIGTAVGVLRLAPTPFNQAVAAAAMFGLMMALGSAFYTLSKNTDSGSMLAIQTGLHKNAEKSVIAKILSRLQFLIKRDFFALLFLVLGLLGKPSWALLGVAVVTNAGWPVILALRSKLK